MGYQLIDHPESDTPSGLPQGSNPIRHALPTSCLDELWLLKTGPESTKSLMTDSDAKLKTLKHEAWRWNWWCISPGTFYMWEVSPGSLYWQGGPGSRDTGPTENEGSTQLSHCKEGCEAGRYVDEVRIIIICLKEKYGEAYDQYAGPSTGKDCEEKEFAYIAGGITGAGIFMILLVPLDLDDLCPSHKIQETRETSAGTQSMMDRYFNHNPQPNHHNHHHLTHHNHHRPQYQQWSKCFPASAQPLLRTLGGPWHHNMAIIMV